MQQAALVLNTLAGLYPQVRIVRDFVGRYDYPGVPAAAKLTSITGQGEVVDWTPRWVDDPRDYEVVRLATSR